MAQKRVLKEVLLTARQRREMRVRHVIDWLSITLWNDAGTRDYLPFPECCKVATDCRPLNGYDQAVKLECGALKMWCKNRDSMGVHFQFSGDALDTVRRELDCDEGTLMRVLYHEQMKGVARLDVATDVFNVGSVDSVISTTNKGGLKSRLLPTAIHSDWRVPKNGKTAYFGSPESDFRVRIYDKAHEMKSLWQAWTRIEAQTRNQTATALYRDAVANGNIGNAVHTVHKRLSFPTLEWYETAMRRQGEKIQVPKPETDFDGWIRKQVIPGCRTKMLAGTNETSLFELYELLANHFDG